MEARSGYRAVLFILLLYWFPRGSARSATARFSPADIGSNPNPDIGYAFRWQRAQHSRRFSSHWLAPSKGMPKKKGKRGATTAAVTVSLLRLAGPVLDRGRTSSLDCARVRHRDAPLSCLLPDSSFVTSHCAPPNAIYAGVHATCHTMLAAPRDCYCCRCWPVLPVLLLPVLLLLPLLLPVLWCCWLVVGVLAVGTGAAGACDAAVPP